MSSCGDRRRHGPYPASFLISTDPGKTQLPGRVRRKSFAAPPISPDTLTHRRVSSVDFRRLYPPE